MTPDDAYANLPPNIADALERAETKYRESLNPANPYAHLPLLASERILGAEFSAYQNTDTSLPEDLASSPILLHSASARFHGLCRFITCHWTAEFPRFLERVIGIEQARRSRIPVPETDESDLLGYGLQITEDVYIVGFTGPETATITNKALVLGLFTLLCDAFAAIPGPAKIDFDPAALKTRLEAACRSKS